MSHVMPIFHPQEYFHREVKPKDKQQLVNGILDAINPYQMPEVYLAFEQSNPRNNEGARGSHWIPQFKSCGCPWPSVNCGMHYNSGKQKMDCPDNYIFLVMVVH